MTASEVDHLITGPHGFDTNPLHISAGGQSCKANGVDAPVLSVQQSPNAAGTLGACAAFLYARPDRRVERHRSWHRAALH